MKKSRFTDSQIIAIFNQNEVGITVPDLYREHGISSVVCTNGAPNLAAWTRHS